MSAGASGEFWKAGPAGSSAADANFWQPLKLHWNPDAPDLAEPEVRWFLTGRSGFPKSESSEEAAPSASAGRLVWEMKLPLPWAARETFASGGFTPELWRQDVAECFLGNPRSGRYIEFNLSPGGAWWACVFTAPRVPLQPQPSPDSFAVETSVAWFADHWMARMSVPLELLAGEDIGAGTGTGAGAGAGPEHPAAQDLVVNFAAVRATPPPVLIANSPPGQPSGTPELRRNFFSLAPLGGEVPDFHRPDEWLKLVFPNF